MFDRLAGALQHSVFLSGFFFLIKSSGPKAEYPNATISVLKELRHDSLSCFLGR